MIGPGGVFIIDSKQYRGRLQLDASGRLWHGRYPLAPTLQAVSFEADQAALVLPDPGVVVVVPVVCAGINRHGEGDERALHRRSSDPRWPRVMRRRS